MYSMVLMAALTSGDVTPDLFHKNYGHGYYGGGYGMGWGGNCYGSYGWASCYGGWNNCGGGGYGGYAGGWGGGYGGGWGNCYGTCVGGWGIHGYGAFGCHGCYGCYGCYGCVGYAPGHIPNFNPASPIPRDNDTLPAPKKADGEKESMAPTNARLIVELPTDARLTVDGYEMKTAAGRGVFTTPALKDGETYYYELRVEAVRGGKRVAEDRRVLVRAGQEVRATFKDLDTVSTARAK
jgi:uncharacterized protein (TIGR03000 family)